MAAFEPEAAFAALRLSLGNGATSAGAGAAVSSRQRHCNAAATSKRVSEILAVARSAAMASAPSQQRRRTPVVIHPTPRKMAMLSATRDIADAAAAAHSIETVTERDRQKLIFEERRATLMRKLQRDRALPEIQVADSGSFGSDSDEDAVARRAGVHALAPTPSRAHFIVPETPLAHAGKCESRSAFNETCATLPPPQRSATRASPPSSQAVLPDLSSMTRRELQSEAKAHVKSSNLAAGLGLICQNNMAGNPCPP